MHELTVHVWLPVTLPALTWKVMEGSKEAALRMPLCGDWPRPLALLFVAAAWAAFGFLFGWHWWALFLVAARTPADRRACALHFCLHLAALFVTGAGGAWCRSASSTYIPCDGNQTMTRICLWGTQPLDYQVIYTMHFVSGGALLCMGVLDVVQFPGWTLCTRSLTALYSPYRLAPAYALTLGIATFCVTITWTALVDWDDATLNSLLGVLLLVILVVGALSAASLRLLAPRYCTPAGAAPRAARPDV
jgi:hypothetical protein